MLFRGWGPELAMDNDAHKNQWKLVDMGAGSVHKEFMLNTDLCLAFNHSQSKPCMMKSAPSFEWGNRSANFWIRNPECRFNEAANNGADLKADTANMCCTWTKKE